MDFKLVVGNVFETGGQRLRGVSVVMQDVVLLVLKEGE